VGRRRGDVPALLHLAAGGENVAESLQRGMRVVVQGRLKARSYETREGEKRTVFEIEVDEIGPSLKFATAKVNRTSRQGGGGGYSGGGRWPERPGRPVGARPTTRGPLRRLRRRPAGQGRPGRRHAGRPVGRPRRRHDEPPF
jgi:single-strand DNA-binding protein